jgi:hypothetical protein
MREQDRERLRTLRSQRHEGRRGGRQLHGRVAALLVFGAIAVLIAKQEVPWVDSWIDRLLDESAWQAAEQCRDMARKQTGEPDFSRLKKSGTTEKTGGGYHVSGVVIAVLDAQGGERTYHFSCNVTAAGEVVAIHSESVNVDKLKANNKPVWQDETTDP